LYSYYKYTQNQSDFNGLLGFFAWSQRSGWCVPCQLPRCFLKIKCTPPELAWHAPACCSGSWSVTHQAAGPLARAALSSPSAAPTGLARPAVSVRKRGNSQNRIHAENPCCVEVDLRLNSWECALITV